MCVVDANKTARPFGPAPAIQVMYPRLKRIFRHMRMPKNHTGELTSPALGDAQRRTISIE